jgi:hypothetical protein
VKYRLLFLFTLSSFGAFSAHSTVDVSRCERLLKPSGEYTAISDLPAVIEIAVKKEKAQTYFELANDNFKEVLASTKLSFSLENVSDPSAQASLKRTRKYGQLIRSAFQVFSEDHKIPKKLDLFVVDLGRLNDYIEGKVTRKISQETEVVKTDLVAIDGMNWIDKFSPAKKSSIQDFIGGKMDDLRDTLENKKFTAHEFHEIRLMLKNLMNLYFFRAAFDEGEDSKRIYQFVLQLNQEMGEIHDDLVLKDNQGEIDYDRYKLKLPQSIRKKILALLDRIQ